MRSFAKRIAEEWIFYTSLFACVFTSALLRRIPKYTIDDAEVIFILFVFLVVVKGLQESGLLSAIASGLEGKFLNLKLIAITAILSAFLTNDVALLTIVPITLSMDVEEKECLIISETLTANAASSLTPFGNPQNILIFHHYRVQPVDFVMTILPFVIASMLFVILLSCVRGVSNENSGRSEMEFTLNRKTILYVLFFLIFVLAVLRILPVFIGMLVIIYAILRDRKSLKIDYYLLGTFLFFFGFTDNLSTVLSFSLTQNGVFLASAMLSQVMSNVPTALLMEGFVTDWRPLLWGVSVGGFGTLFASLANLISYRLYVQHHGQSSRFLLRFHLHSFVVFFLGIALYFLIFHFGSF